MAHVMSGVWWVVAHTAAWGHEQATTWRRGANCREGVEVAFLCVDFWNIYEEYPTIFYSFHLIWFLQKQINIDEYSFKQKH